MNQLELNGCKKIEFPKILKKKNYGKYCKNFK